MIPTTLQTVWYTSRRNNNNNTNTNNISLKRVAAGFGEFRTASMPIISR